MLLKKQFILITVISAALAIFSCNITGNIVLDPDMPAEQTAKVRFQRSIYVTHYNGIDVEDAWYPRGYLKANTVTLPAGETTLNFDIAYSFSYFKINYSLDVNDIELRYNFEPGKEYTVGNYVSENLGNFFIPKFKVYVGIWDQIYPADTRPEKNKAIRSWEIGET